MEHQTVEAQSHHAFNRHRSSIDCCYRSWEEWNRCAIDWKSSSVKLYSAFRDRSVRPSFSFSSSLDGADVSN